MRYFLLPFSAVILFSFLAAAEAGQSGAQQTGTAAKNFDPRDFTGYWIRHGERANNPPPLTAHGKAMMEGRKPDYLLTKGHPEVEGNDPMYKCNPQGFPRLVWEENEPIEIVMLPNRILQLFQWERTLRELWLDGRSLPSGDNLASIGPNWYGHSVAHWEGNTLVVLTTGVNEKAWIDEYAHPASFDATMEERYTRINADTIEGHLTINDPKNYTAPWVYPTHTFQRMSPKNVTFFGWTGLFHGVSDGICAPMNVEDDYNKRIRDPSIFGDKR